MQEHGGLGSKKKLSFDDERIAYAGIPHRQEFGEYYKVLDAACGYGFSLFSVKSKNEKVVFGCGINTDSQLGFDVKDKKLKFPVILTPRPINLPLKKKTTKVLGLAAGRAHSLILTDDGLYGLGNNGYGQCGRPIITDENYLHSRAVSYIPDIKGEKITSVCAGQDHR